MSQVDVFFSSSNDVDLEKTSVNHRICFSKKKITEFETDGQGEKW